MPETADWLLQGPPWVQYRTRVDLLGQAESAPEVQAARAAMLAHPQVQALLTELSDWPGPPLKRHNDASHALHKLTFVADLGLRAGDAGVDAILARVLERRAPDGPFQVVVNIDPRYGGAGVDQAGWSLCDAPSVLYALARMGLGQDARVQAAAAHLAGPACTPPSRRSLAGMLRENGWPCAVSPALGKFRGPGRKSDPCPYATLIALKALAQMPEWRDGPACRTGAEALLGLWQQRKERKPYLFGMGTDFIKLKAPLIWYDVLHVLDVLTQFPWLRPDPRLRELSDLAGSKADAQGRYTPESVWKAWSEWDFGQKKAPSTWLTLLVLRALGRNKA